MFLTCGREAFAGGGPTNRRSGCSCGRYCAGGSDTVVNLSHVRRPRRSFGVMPKRSCRPIVGSTICTIHPAAPGSLRSLSEGIPHAGPVNWVRTAAWSPPWSARCLAAPPPWQSRALRLSGPAMFPFCRLCVFMCEVPSRSHPPNMHGRGRRILQAFPCACARASPAAFRRGRSIHQRYVGPLLRLLAAPHSR